MKTTKKALEKRKRERVGLPAFFQKHIPQIVECENCGLTIQNPDAKNVAHVLAKEKFKSVMINDDNVMYLCSDLDRDDGKGCHDIYDNRPHEEVIMHPMWKLAVERFKKFEHKIKEKSTTLLKFWNDASYKE